MQGEVAGRVGEPSGQGEEASPEGLGGHNLLTQTDAGGPAGQIMRQHLHRQPGAVGSETPRGEMVQPDAVLEVSDRILDLGVAAMVGLQFQGVAVPIGDEAVIFIGGEEGSWEPGAGFFTRRTMSRTGAAPGSLRKGTYVVSATAAAPSIQ